MCFFWGPVTVVDRSGIFRARLDCVLNAVGEKPQIEPFVPSIVFPVCSFESKGSPLSGIRTFDRFR